MNFSKFLMGGAACAALLFLSGCNGALKEDNGGKEEPEKVKVEFSQNEISIPVKGTSTLELTVTPIERAGEVEIVVADDEVVTLTDKEMTETGIRLSLASNSRLGSTTIYAVHEDLEGTPECKVTITPIAVEGIALDKTSLELKVHESATLSPAITPDDATSPVITWKSDNEDVAVVEGGKVTGVKEGTATITATCNGHEAQCSVKVTATVATSIVLACETADLSKTVEIVEEEQILVNATILPEDVTYVNVSWSVAPEGVVSCKSFDAVSDDNLVSAYIVGQTPGEAVVTATIDGVSSSFTVKVSAKSQPEKPAKIGDYFYSDGTWSDGGLISINPDGTNPVWAATKPAPVEGKTVIGIVFQTNSERIYSSLKESGYTHGLVIGVGALYNPAQKSNPNYARIASYTLDDEFGCIGGKRYTGYRWYNDLAGKYWTERVCKYYPGEELENCPAFDFATTDYPLPAPTTTSGWYVPSSGELWDYLANLGGSELAAYLKSFRDYGSECEAADFEGDQATFDITSFEELKLSYNLLDKLNEAWALVPENVRDDLFYCYNKTRCQLSSSTIYEKGEACCIFDMTSDNGFSFQRGWICGDPMIFHPVLAF